MLIFDPLLVPPSWQRSFGAATVFLLVLLWSACGQFYRPVATPIIPAQPNPSINNVAIVITENGATHPGASTTIDVAGDTPTSQATVGLMPVYALLNSSSTVVYVANSGDNTVSTFSVSAPTPVVTISMAPGSAPNFVASTETATVYVANAGNGTVSVIDTTSNAVTNTIQVGATPVAMAEIANGLKLYVVNSNPASVVSINPINQTVNPPIAPFPGTSWIAPVLVVGRSDSQRAYVLDQGAGSVSAIDTFSDSVVATPAPVGAGANFMSYDPNFDRIYVTNPTTSTLTVLDASVDTLPATSVSVANPVSVTALPPYGNRAYVASATLAGTAPNQTVSASLTALDAQNLQVMATIPLSSLPHVAGCPTQTSAELSVAAAADGSRVYVGNCDAGNTALIQTSNNSEMFAIAAPTSAIPPANVSVNSALESGSNTIYTFQPLSGPALRSGMSIAIEGMRATGNNGTFVITGVGAGTFTVTNPAGVTAAGDSGVGMALTPQSPILVIAGSLPTTTAPTPTPAPTPPSSGTGSSGSGSSGSGSSGSGSSGSGSSGSGSSGSGSSGSGSSGSGSSGSGSSGSGSSGSGSSGSGSSGSSGSST
jgi:YVTN family beta-propeller protein